MAFAERTLHFYSDVTPWRASMRDRRDRGGDLEEDRLVYETIRLREEKARLYRQED